MSIINKFNLKIMVYQTKIYVTRKVLYVERDNLDVTGFICFLSVYR